MAISCPSVKYQQGTDCRLVLHFLRRSSTHAATDSHGDPGCLSGILKAEGKGLHRGVPWGPAAGARRLQARRRGCRAVWAQAECRLRAHGERGFHCAWICTTCVLQSAFAPAVLTTTPVPVSDPTTRAQASDYDLSPGPPGGPEPCPSRDMPGLAGGALAQVFTRKEGAWGMTGYGAGGGRPQACCHVLPCLSDWGVH